MPSACNSRVTGSARLSVGKEVAGHAHWAPPAVRQIKTNWDADNRTSVEGSVWCATYLQTCPLKSILCYRGFFSCVLGGGDEGMLLFILQTFRVILYDNVRNYGFEIISFFF